VSISEGVSRRSLAGKPALRVTLGREGLLLLMGFVFGTIFLRLPTFFEPPWHTDEGIFQAVAQRVASGGQLYADAWESKPPLFLYIHVAILEVFGPGVLPLRIVTTAFAVAAELTVFCIALRFMSRRQAVLAAAVLALLLAVPFWDGNLAVADNFALLPTALAVLFVLKGREASQARLEAAWLLAAGVCLGAAFLIRQTSVLAGVAVVLWLFAGGGRWLRSAALIASGSAVVVLPAVGAFAVFGSFHWFWDANVGFFFEYVPSGRELPLYQRPLIVLPLIVAFGALLLYRSRGTRPRWGLAALWFTFTLSAALLTGRSYSHYFLQAFPPLALLLALVLPQVRLSWRPSAEQRPALAIAASVALLWVAVVTPAYNWDPSATHYSKTEHYYVNFAGWALGLRSDDAYNRYFDLRVNLTNDLDETLARLGAEGEKLYIWGELPWVYALSESQPATPYTTSFYVLLRPNLDLRLWHELERAQPRFIVFMDAWPRVADPGGVGKYRFYHASRAVLSLIAERYEQVASVGRAEVYRRAEPRPLVPQGAPAVNTQLGSP
jgi:hypothetical protein